MNNPEDIFQHLPPMDRPEPAEPRPVRTPREEVLLGIAAKARILLPVDDDEKSARYSDFDRKAYIVDKAAELDIELDHLEASRYIELAEKEAWDAHVKREQTGAQERYWREFGTDMPRPSNFAPSEDQRTTILHRLDDQLELTAAPHEPKVNQEAEND